MKFKTIKWIQHPDFTEVYQGMISDHEAFTVTDIGKKGLKFELKSWPLKSNTFHTSATPKRLGEYSTLKLAQYEAVIRWDEFINELIELEVPDQVTKTELVS